MESLESVNTSVFILSTHAFQGQQLLIQNFSQVADLSSNSIQKIDVLILTLASAQQDEVRKFLHLLHAGNPAAQIVLIAPRRDETSELLGFLKQFSVFLILESISHEELETAALQALERAQQFRQTQSLEQLVRDQNKQLKELYLDLEDRIQKRQKFLLEAQQKSQQAHSRWRLLLLFSEALQGSESLGQIESLLDQFIGSEFLLAAVRLIMGPSSENIRHQLKQQNLSPWTECSLFFGEKDLQRGSIFFIARPHSAPFKKEEFDFFSKIAEVVSLAIDRIIQFENNLALQQHWQATFNAVSEPVMIINAQYDVVQSNLAFEKYTKPGLKCYDRLFGRSAPCSECLLGKNFRKEQDRIFEVHSHSLNDFSSRETLFVNQYHDITEQTHMEKKILEAARLAEIGMIGSSIAHELNNPLGGMLSYTQLIKMDLKQDHPFYKDIEAIETGIKKSRDIVQNLLGFSRNPILDAKAKVDLREVLSRAIKIVELQSKSLGIEIRLSVPNEVVWVSGFAGYLAQGLQNVLQSSIQNILQESRQSGIQGLIEIVLESNDGNALLQIMDNGPGLAHWTSLGLSMASQIFKDHGGFIEFLEDRKPFHSVKVLLPLWNETA